MKVYASHSHWSPLSEIKELEVNDRGNCWFDDSDLNLDKTLAKWACYLPEHALWYLFRADFHGLNPLEDSCPREEEDILKEWEEFKHAWNNPESYVEIIEIGEAYAVHDDPDGGALFIKAVYK